MSRWTTQWQQTLIPENVNDLINDLITDSHFCCFSHLLPDNLTLSDAHSLTIIQLMQNFGKADKTTDDLFELYSNNFNKQQNSATRLQKEMKNYVTCLRGMWSHCVRCCCCVCIWGSCDSVNVHHHGNDVCVSYVRVRLFHFSFHCFRSTDCVSWYCTGRKMNDSFQSIHTKGERGIGEFNHQTGDAGWRGWKQRGGILLLLVDRLSGDSREMGISSGTGVLVT